MVRLGLIGCGGISKGHSVGFDRFGDRLKVVAVADADAAQAEKASHEYAVPHTATDFREILDQVDAVLLALPHHLHHPIGIECLRAGKHVLMEKPLANSEDECLDLIRTADEAGAVLMVGYTMRYNPLCRHLKTLLDERTYGDTFHMSIWTEQYTHKPEGHWINQAKFLGGGQFFSHGCHYIDLLLWYLGEPESGTHIGTNYGTPWMEKEGTSDATIKFAGGAVGYHGGTWGARGTRLKWAIHVHCTEAMLELDLSNQRLIVHRGALEEEFGSTESLTTERETASTGEAKSFEAQMAHFLECVETGAQPETNAVDSLQSLKVIWRLYEAEQNGRIADLRGLGLRQFSDKFPIGV